MGIHNTRGMRLQNGGYRERERKRERISRKSEIARERERYGAQESRPRRDESCEREKTLPLCELKSRKLSRKKERLGSFSATTKMHSIKIIYKACDKRNNLNEVGL